MTTLPDRTATSHPEVLQDVVLRLERTIGDPLVVRAKVLDIEPTAEGNMLVLSCPPGVDRRQHHFEAKLTWTYPMGRMECSVTTSPAERKYGDVWLAVPQGTMTRLQERQYFRATLSIPVHLVWPDPEPVDETGDAERSGEERTLQETAGAVVDLSEGGLLAALTTKPAPSVGTVLDLTLHVDDGSLTTSGIVVREVTFAGGGVGVAVAFNDPTEHGDRIRRLAFEAERRRRRTT
ncbi:MAG TPA: PilZ domain-containing protein [Nocardioides sp.]|nr:PilZ domain-containing protein [Nocardioides sp.]